MSVGSAGTGKKPTAARENESAAHELPERRILLCTLGGSWAVIPEVYGFLAPEVLDLYRDHPQRKALRAQRERLGTRSPEAIWVVTTGGEATTNALRILRRWHRLLPGAKRPALRVWRAEGTDALASATECERMRELTLRVCLAARRRSCMAGGQLVLSLAGGRKTMSADMQRAASAFGAHTLLHVIDVGELDQALKKPNAELLAAPLSRRLAGCLSPVVLDVELPGSELLEVEIDGRASIDPERFCVPAASGDRAAWWQAPSGARNEPWLHEEIARREREGARLFGNMLGALAREERRENWRGLYRLPPRLIDRLRRAPLDDLWAAWFAGLPKAELHCHVGGVLRLPGQIRVASTIWEQTGARSASGRWRLCGGGSRAGGGRSAGIFGCGSARTGRS